MPTLVGLFLGIMSMEAEQALQAAQEDTLRMTFTTTTAGGDRRPKNVHAIYLTIPTGQFITTVGNGTSTKRALWGNKGAHDIRQWFTSNPNPNPNADIDARTGATESNYKTYTIQWNCTKRDGSAVSDGTYLLKFEMTDANFDKNKFNRTQFTITKARQAWTIGPVSQGGYNNVRLEYTPGQAQPIEIEVSPTILDFARVPVDQGKDMSVTIFIANRLGEILVIDATDPTNPTLVSRILLNQTVTSLFAAQQTLYAALVSGDIMQFDVSIPTQPQWCHTTATQSAIQSLGYGTHLLLADPKG